MVEKEWRMSEQEKVEQIGRAMVRFQQADREAAHLEEKLRRTREAFADTAKRLVDWRPSTMGSQIPVWTPNTLVSDLCNEAELMQLLESMQLAEDAVRSERKILQGLGITALPGS